MKRLHTIILSALTLVASSCVTKEDPEQINGKIATIEQQVSAIEVSISSLKSTDAKFSSLGNSPLSGSIDALTKYLEEELRINKDWTAATLATLGQYQSVLTSLYEAQQSIASLNENEKSELERSISESSSSMKRWVNEQFEAYGDIALMDAKIKAFKGSDASTQLAASILKSDLLVAGTELTRVYANVINEAITKYNGEIRNHLAIDIKTANNTLHKKVEALAAEFTAMASPGEFFLKKPFTISSIGATSVSISKNGEPHEANLNYSVNGCEWKAYKFGDEIPLSDGDYLQFKNKSESHFSTGADYYGIIVNGSGKVSASGNIMSLLHSEMKDIPLEQREFYSLFSGCTALVDASNLILPSMTLVKSCYLKMFLDCVNLTSAPALPATSLADHCYSQMFQGCSSLIHSPALPATTLADYCYSQMFNQCISLISAPVLPATSMTMFCYWGMFCDCSSLTSAPDLPGTTLAKGCYYEMFMRCGKLTRVSNLPATTLADYCYYSMFLGCTSLTSVPALPATQLANSCYAAMFQECTNLTSAPALPAKTLAAFCYDHMFSRCESLTTTPNLPATTLAEACYRCMFLLCFNLTSASSLPATTLASSCYDSMFSSCKKLSSAPALPATALTPYCYNCMFSDCTSLTSAPALPATTLAGSCYSMMFKDCTSLASAPALPATTLSSLCYSSMFNGCSSLTSAPDLPAKTLADLCYLSMFTSCPNLKYVKALFTDPDPFRNIYQWIGKVSSDGTFVKSKDAMWNDSDVVPYGWTILTE